MAILVEASSQPGAKAIHIASQQGHGSGWSCSWRDVPPGVSRLASGAMPEVGEGLATLSSQTFSLPDLLGRVFSTRLLFFTWTLLGTARLTTSSLEARTQKVKRCCIAATLPDFGSWFTTYNCIGLSLCTRQPILGPTVPEDAKRTGARVPAPGTARRRTRRSR